MEKNAGKDEVWGLTLHESFNSVVGQVAMLKRTAIGLKLHKVVCAVDCGIAVNPNIVAMQMESGIGYGLAAALTGAITLKDGRIEQSNFDDYPVLRMNQMPAVDVHIVPSIGEAHGRRRTRHTRHRTCARECAGGSNGQGGVYAAVGRPGDHVGVNTVECRSWSA